MIASTNIRTVLGPHRSARAEEARWVNTLDPSVRPSAAIRFAARQPQRPQLGRWALLVAGVLLVAVLGAVALSAFGPGADAGFQEDTAASAQQAS